jgi:hypothetical protein
MSVDAATSVGGGAMDSPHLTPLSASPALTVAAATPGPWPQGSPFSAGSTFFGGGTSPLLRASPALTSPMLSPLSVLSTALDLSATPLPELNPHCAQPAAPPAQPQPPPQEPSPQPRAQPQQQQQQGRQLHQEQRRPPGAPGTPSMGAARVSVTAAAAAIYGHAVTRAGPIPPPSPLLGSARAVGRAPHFPGAQPRPSLRPGFLLRPTASSTAAAPRRPSFLATQQRPAPAPASAATRQRPTLLPAPAPAAAEAQQRPTLAPAAAEAQQRPTLAPAAGAGELDLALPSAGREPSAASKSAPSSPAGREGGDRAPAASSASPATLAPVAGSAGGSGAERASTAVKALEAVKAGEPSGGEGTAVRPPLAVGPPGRDPKQKPEREKEGRPDKPLRSAPVRPGFARPTAPTAPTNSSGSARVRPAASGKGRPAGQLVSVTVMADAAQLPPPRSPVVKAEPASPCRAAGRGDRVAGQKSRVAPRHSSSSAEAARLTAAASAAEPAEAPPFAEAAGAGAPRLGDSAAEVRELERAKKKERKRQKELMKEQIKRGRLMKRVFKHCVNKLGIKPANLDAVLDAAPMEPPLPRWANVIDLCVLPFLSDSIALSRPLMYPFDCISFDGKFMLTVLAMTKRRGTPTICRFIRTPPEDADLFIGPVGRGDPQESFLYPSLNSSAKRAYGKSANGWNCWYVLVVHESRTYRVALDRFRKSKDGPGFLPRPGISFSESELDDMCALAAKSHAAISEQAAKGFFSLVHTMGSHSLRNVLPDFLEPFLRAVPTVINPKPTELIPYEQWLLPPVTNTFMPTFCWPSA